MYSYTIYADLYVLLEDGNIRCRLVRIIYDGVEWVYMNGDDIDDNRYSINRRKILKHTGTGLFASSLFSSAAAATGARANQSNNKQTGAGKGSSMTLTKSNSMSRSEFDDYVQRMHQKYGDMAAGITPRNLSHDSNISPQQQAPNTTNLTYERAWNDEFNISVGCCGTIAKTDHALTLYSGQKTDNNGRTIYILWQWSQSKASGGLNEGRTDTVRNHVNFTSNDIKLAGFDPDSPRDVNGRTYNIGLTVGYGGVTMGINGSTYLKSGVIKPETGKVDTGSSGQYSVLFEGCQGDITGVNGAIDARSHNSIFGGDIDWNVYVHANTVCA